MRKHKEEPMPFVTAGHTTPGENNEFFKEQGSHLGSVLGLVAVVVLVTLLVLWLA